MEDRVSLYPGRVKLTPVSGQTDVYDMVRADEPTQEGTALNKATFLTDTVAALLGLGPEATPNNAFFELSKSRLHWWKRRTVEAGYKEYLHPAATVRFNDDVVSDSAWTVKYSNSIKVDPSSGSISLVSPSTTSVSYDNQNHKLLVGKYFYLENRLPLTIYKSAPDSVASRDFYYDSYWESYYYATDLSNCREVEAVWSEASGDWEYIYSDDQDAYPTGTIDGVEWVYLGIPFENARDGVKIETGSYIGTGTYASANKNSLTFGFIPKLVMIRVSSASLTNVNASSCLIFVNPSTCGNIEVGTSAYTVVVSWTENGVSWYATQSASVQFNASGVTYNYVAIG